MRRRVRLICPSPLWAIARAEGPSGPLGDKRAERVAPVPRIRFRFRFRLGGDERSECWVTHIKPLYIK